MHVQRLSRRSLASSKQAKRAQRHGATISALRLVKRDRQYPDADISLKPGMMQLFPAIDGHSDPRTTA